MKIPSRLFAYWLRDVSGEWLLRTDTSIRRLGRERKRDSRDGYPVTAIITYTEDK